MVPPLGCDPVPRLNPSTPKCAGKELLEMEGRFCGDANAPKIGFVEGGFDGGIELGLEFEFEVEPETDIEAEIDEGNSDDSTLPERCDPPPEGEYFIEASEVARLSMSNMEEAVAGDWANDSLHSGSLCCCSSPALSMLLSFSCLSLSCSAYRYR